MLNFLLPAHLNSIMFLLILCVGRFAYIIQSYFKFHYVSINANIRMYRNDHLKMYKITL